MPHVRCFPLSLRFDCRKVCAAFVSVMQRSKVVLAPLHVVSVVVGTLVFVVGTLNQIWGDEWIGPGPAIVTVHFQPKVTGAQPITQL